MNLILVLKLGIGDWGLGIGDWAQSPIPNPQSPNIIQYNYYDLLIIILEYNKKIIIKTISKIN